jgi:membrane-associated protease RseP (regulator of RpoE activity)
VSVYFISRPRPRYWLYALSFALTILSTLIVGARLQYNFAHQLAAYDIERDFFPVFWALERPSRLLLGIPFSATLLGILLAHELGHYLYCRRYHVFATLPFFLPAPTVIGTFGAFIRIKSPIPTRQALFDIGIAGPIAGFVVAVPALLFALLQSRPLDPGIPPSDLTFGYPLIFHLAHWLLNALVPGYALHSASGAIALSATYMHPTAIAAWVGMFATALNLIPGGQLDGGHIVFALFPRAHRWISRAVVIALIPLGIKMWAGWLVWALLLTISGMRHPQVPPYPELSPGRRFLAVVALLIFLLTIMPAPFVGAGIR